VYLFAALSKINRTYLSGATMAAYVSPAVLAVAPESGRTAVVLAMTWGSILVELWLAFALWSPRCRATAVATGIAFHAVMIALLPSPVRYQLTVFAVEMLALYVVFAVPLTESER
jgi:hypothetical protein